MATMLSPHFTLEEMTYSQTAARQGINNTPPPDIVEKLRKLCETLELVRTALGAKPILISSGYRSPELNRAIGGATNSAHMSGLAADFTCPAFGTALQICRAVDKADIQYDQLIYEYDQWVHLGLVADMQNARNQNLTINGYGTTTGFA